MLRTAVSPIVAVILTFFCQCAPSRLVKPLAKGERVITGSLGGPLIHFAGAVIPMPFTTAGYAQGLTGMTTAYGHLHTTSLLFGNLQADAGCTLRLWEKKEKAGVSLSPALQLAWSARNKTDFRVWPSADVNFYFHPGRKPAYLYAGLNSWFELSPEKAHGEDRTRIATPNLQAGYVIAGTKWQHQFEVKYLGIGIPVYPGVVDYVGLGGKGTFGVYYSVMKKF
jgi:hypothetical protein